jgi:hypothetical protein
MRRTDEEPTGPMMSEEEEFATAIGVTPEQIAEDCRANCQYFAAEEVGDLSSWTEAVGGVFDICCRQLVVPWTDLATRFCAVVTREDFEEKEPTELRQWEAVVRRVVNLIMASDGEEYESARQYDWQAWIKNPTYTKEPDDGQDESDE